jgi:hypothetical protein
VTDHRFSRCGLLRTGVLGRRRITGGGVLHRHTRQSDACRPRPRHLGMQDAADPQTRAMSVKPRQPIRRFDVFAEFRRQEEQSHGMPADQAKGYGLWIAKVVAARKFGRLRGADRPSTQELKARRRRKWHVLGGERQTDKLFDHEIVERMGREFYADEFAPAIRHAREDGQSYESMRDRLRRRWKPAK